MSKYMQEKMKNYIAVFKVQGGEECEIYESTTLKGAADEATKDHKHLNYGRSGVVIYELGNKVFVKDI